MALKEDYKDAVFAGLRKYKMLDNGDGTVSPVDMTEYETAGDKFGAKDVNAITKMVNCTGDAFDPGRDYEVGDYTIYDNTVWKFTTAHPAGMWDESHVEKTRILAEIAEQNKNFAELNEKFQILTGSFASYNAQTLLSYPTGYNKNNVACLTINGYIDSYVANAITEDWCHISFGDSSIIITTKNEGVVGHLFKIMIGKI